jgi:hypothetical protein
MDQLSNADAELAGAAAHLDRMSERVFGEGGVLEQITTGEWNEHLTDSEKVDLAELEVVAERVRFTREHAAELEPASQSIRGPQGELVTSQVGVATAQPQGALLHRHRPFDAGRQ